MHGRCLQLPLTKARCPGHRPVGREVETYDSHLPLPCIHPNLLAARGRSIKYGRMHQHAKGRAET